MLSEKEILEVLELFQKSDWEDMQLRSGSLQLNISKTGRGVSRVQGGDLSPVAATKLPAAPTTIAAARPAVVKAAAPIDPDWIAVTAPMLGTFYAAPKPGAPPFVIVGQDVSAEDTVAILEVMKLMNHIKAGTRGRIVQVVASNGELVEFDQVLIYIDPARPDA